MSTKAKVLIAIALLGGAGLVWYFAKNKPIPFVPKDSPADLEKKYPGAPQELIDLMVAFASIVNDTMQSQSARDQAKAQYDQIKAILDSGGQ